jgi:twitching motility protein PilT
MANDGPIYEIPVTYGQDVTPTPSSRSSAQPAYTTIAPPAAPAPGRARVAAEAEPLAFLNAPLDAPPPAAQTYNPEPAVYNPEPAVYPEPSAFTPEQPSVYNPIAPSVYTQLDGPASAAAAHAAPAPAPAAALPAAPTPAPAGFTMPTADPNFGAVPLPSSFVDTLVSSALNSPPVLSSSMAPPTLAPPPAAVKEPRVFASPSTDGDLLAALDRVVELGASDLHVTVDSTPMLRLHGDLMPVPGAFPWDFEKIHSALHSIITDEQREIFETELELDLAYTLSADARFRVNIYQQRGSMGAAFRLIPTEIKQLSELGVPDAIGRFARLPRGLVLITGPTGSGKSTTLAALIDLVNRERADHIVTVEDPIEFLHTNKKSLVNQREVGGDTHSFNQALKHVLRQDPDVILIGELRDLETISVALTAAETGHLVFATLHTQSAGQTIDRVIDVFPPHQQGQVRAQLAATLQGVVCQTLIKHASGVGRVVATEVMITTPALANLIREGKTYQVPSAMQAGRDQGMHTMDQHLAELVNAGTISHEAAMEKAQDREDLLQLIRREQSSGRFGARTMSMGN